MYLYVYFVSNFNIILCFQKIIILQHKVCAGYLGLLTSLLKLRFLVNNFPLKFTISMELINDIHTFILFIYAREVVIIFIWIILLLNFELLFIIVKFDKSSF